MDWSCGFWSSYSCSLNKPHSAHANLWSNRWPAINQSRTSDRTYRSTHQPWHWWERLQTYCIDEKLSIFVNDYSALSMFYGLWCIIYSFHYIYFYIMHDYKTMCGFTPTQPQWAPFCSWPLLKQVLHLIHQLLQNWRTSQIHTETTTRVHTTNHAAADTQENGWRDIQGQTDW